MKTQKTTLKRFIKVVFSTLWIIALIWIIFLIWAFIKITFLNWFEFNTNLYNLKSSIEYNFYTKTKNHTDCDNLNQEDIDLLNEKLEIYWYSWDKDYWCDLWKISINNSKNTVYNEYIDENFEIPKEIYKLENLYRLSLSWIKSANISDFDSISNLTNLIDLSININTWSLEIPEEIYKIKTLKYLWVYWEWFTWSLNSNIWNLDNLKNLRIRQTNIWWELPDELFKLENLREIFLLKNNFSWDFQELLEKLVNLESYYISKNAFIWENPWYISELKTIE